MVKHKEIDIIVGDPFSNCKLDRQQFAKVLTSIVDTYADGFVLSINNKWGTGKTTFVKMWEQELKDNNYQTVYFNAWENDFENNPLTALMGELKTLTKIGTEPEFKKVLNRAAILSKHIAPVVVKAIADKYVNTEDIKNAIDKIANGVTDIFEKEVNEYANKKKGIAEFRQSLSKFIADTNNGRPLIFIVDELDRCRPDYAVAILEQIKHFFSVPNIVFVLSIDKGQLGNAVRGVYGSEQIDADEYLRRFIDIEYSIPEPDSEKYCDYLYNYFGLNEFFNSDLRMRINELNYDGTTFLNTAKFLFKKSNISLRQQEKIFAHSRLVLRSFPFNNFVLPNLFLFLIYIKTLHSDFYNKIKLKQLGLKDLQKEFIDCILFSSEETSHFLIIDLEAYLVYYYNNYISSLSARTLLYEEDITTNSKKLLIKSLTDKSPNGSRFLTVLESRSSGYNNGGDLSIEYLLKKIDITESITF
jgi:hypothetical protein